MEVASSVELDGVGPIRTVSIRNAVVDKLVVDNSGESNSSLSIHCQFGCFLPSKHGRRSGQGVRILLADAPGVSCITWVGGRGLGAPVVSAATVASFVSCGALVAVIEGRVLKVWARG
jgi:hypothetical protein